MPGSAAGGTSASTVNTCKTLLTAARNGLQIRDIGVQKVYPRVLIRNNVIRRVDGLTDSPLYLPSWAIYAISCAYALIEENVIDLDTSAPIHQQSNTAVSYFNNTDSGGKLIQAVDYTQPDNPAIQSDLKTAFEDANLLAI